jgi:hypothetical protein
LGCQSSRGPAQCGLTPRSAPDPLRQAAPAAKRACLCSTSRRAHPASAVGVSSNVMPHQTPFTPMTERSSLRGQRTEYKGRFQVRGTSRSSVASTSRFVGMVGQKTERLIAAQEDFRVKVRASFRAWPQRLQDRGSARHFQNSINLELLFKLQGQAARTHRASLSEPLLCGTPRSGGVPPLLCRQPRRAGFRSSPGEVTNFSCACTVRHNPSLSPRPTTAGRLARAARWFMLHHAGKPSCLRGRG